MFLEYYKYILILPLSYLILLSILPSNNAEVYPHILDLDKFEWKKFSLPNDKQRAYIVDSSYSGEGTSIECQATFPVQWNVTGSFTASDVRVYGPVLEKSGTFFRIFNRMKKLSGASLRVACEMIKNPEIFDEVYLFVRSRSNKLLALSNNASVISIKDSKIIPCATYTPRTIVHLYSINSNGEEMLVSKTDHSLQYHPAEGFRSNHPFNGTYVCRQNDSFVIINSTLSAREENQYSPNSDIVWSFDENAVILECQSNSEKTVQILVNQSQVKFLSLDIDHYKKNPWWPRDQTVNANLSIYKLNITEDTEVHPTMKRIIITCELNTLGVSNIKLKASCWKYSSYTGKSVTIKEWEIQFIKTPKLELNNYAREIQCGVPGKIIEAKSINCRNSMECSFLRSHFRKHVVEISFQTQDSERVPLAYVLGEPRKCGVMQYYHNFGCVSLPYTHFNGMVRCGVDGVEKDWEFFESLDNRKYWKQAPRKELLRMDEVPSILYTNSTSEFICDAVEYLFAKRMFFQIEFKNKSVVHLRDENKSLNYYHTRATNESISMSIGFWHPRVIKNLNTVGVLKIRLPIDAVGIHCTVFLWNTTDEVTVSRKFETRHLMEPNRLGEYKKHNFFYIGESNRRLTCSVKGEPEVNYTWSFNNISVPDKFPEIKTSLGAGGESNIEFPVIDDFAQKTYSGIFKCLAKNGLGTVETLFQVEILDTPDGRRNAIYISAAAIGTFIFLIVTVLLAHYMRKYKNAEHLLRNLTDSEVQEFFDGRPDLVDQEENIEMIENMPYNNNFEIPFDDIEFDCSENSILGSGEFGFVVRGLIISKQMPVALKISKTSTDVTVFKSLLSEIKIMAYIGTHENVMCLVGVCTENIRTRSVYIATEICEFGSLKKFLGKSKTSFINLINENNKIDKKRSNDSPFEQTLTTMDLIKFSAHIANGMEYLAYKSVIHADLATRNVLVTREKIAKISDFGLSKRLYESINYVKKSKTPLPWRWMALESLKSLTFSSMSDVWAYGVTLYEIFTLGDAPYPNENWSDEFVARLDNGMRMGRPRYSTQEIYSKIVACWEKEPELRPTFTVLRDFFEKLIVELDQLTTGNAETTLPKSNIHQSASYKEHDNESQPGCIAYENDRIHHPLENGFVYENQK